MVLYKRQITKVKYDKETDVIYVQLSNKPVKKNINRKLY